MASTPCFSSARTSIRRLRSLSSTTRMRASVFTMARLSPFTNRASSTHCRMPKQNGCPFGIARGDDSPYAERDGEYRVSLAHASAVLRRSDHPDGGDAVGAVALREGVSRHDLGDRGFPDGPPQFQPDP